MGKKKSHPEHENLERWLVSYADFITLLFATFTALYAMSQADLAKMKDVSAAIQQGFESQSIISGIKSILQGKSAPNSNPDPKSSDKGRGDGVVGKFENLTYTPGEVKNVEKTVENLKQDLKADNAEIEKKQTEKKPPGPVGSEHQGTHPPNLEDSETPAKGIDVSIQERGLRISFDSRLLFEPGTARLRPESLATLNKIAERLKPYNNTHVIHIEGHTDNLPISSVLFPSNWELSSARASSVVRNMIKNNGFSPDSLVAVGYADSQPLTTNTTPEGRRRNRRVDIILYSRKVGDEITPQKEYAKEKPLVQSKGSKAGAFPQLIHSESTEGEPVKIIFQDADGNVERVINPYGEKGTTRIVPTLKPDIGGFDKTKEFDPKSRGSKEDH